MQKSFIEVIKANKKSIVRTGLILAGTLIGSAIVNVLCADKDDEAEDTMLDGDTNEATDGDSPQNEE